MAIGNLKEFEMLLGTGRVVGSREGVISLKDTRRDGRGWNLYEAGSLQGSKDAMEQVELGD